MKLDFSAYPAIDHHSHPWNEGTKEITKQFYISLMNMGGLSDEEAKDRFPKGFKSVKPYLRVTPQPNK